MLETWHCGCLCTSSPDATAYTSGAAATVPAQCRRLVNPGTNGLPWNTFPAQNCDIFCNFLLMQNTAQIFSLHIFFNQIRPHMTVPQTRDPACFFCSQHSIGPILSSGREFSAAVTHGSDKITSAWKKLYAAMLQSKYHFTQQHVKPPNEGNSRQFT